MLALPSSLGAYLGVFSLAAPAVHRRGRHIGQSALNGALADHARWQEDPTRGRRAHFAGRDLSGLDFGIESLEQLQLRGADFTEADLSGIRANDVNFYHASLQHANLSHSHLKAPVFRGAILHQADCRNAVWGWPAPDAQLCPAKVAASDQAVFMSTCLHGTKFDGARVRGYFNDCSLSGASLCFADFSQSEFSGNEADNRFAGARLVETKFRYATITSARFDKAIVEGADFLGARLHPRIAAYLRDRDARNVEA
ncbi:MULTISPECIES: pentapeptide repeat-containing protein [unclassified Bradyrhizobium]